AHSSSCGEWLSRFGYLPPADPTTGQLQTQEELSKAIAAMQRFGGLETTGILDEATLALMKTPRCSLPDLPAAAPARRRRQAPAPATWNRRSLSWRVRTFPRDSPLGRDTVRALMHYALKVWSDITPLNFHEVAGSAADIQIDFSKADHNDAYPFDGPGGAVAHAFLPGDQLSAGDAHFDDDESWAFRSPDTHDMDLFAVAVHEFGHAIGLSHVAATSSIMQPYYQGPVGDPLHYRLPYEDRVRIWQLYGVRESVSPTAQPDTPEPEEPPLPPEPPNNRSGTPPRKDVPLRCSTDFDAVAQIRGEAFFFKGRYFWRLTRDGHLVSLQPAQMHRFWRGLPLHLDGVDAVFERTSDHKIVFFKGGRKGRSTPEGRSWTYPRCTEPRAAPTCLSRMAGLLGEGVTAPSTPAPWAGGGGCGLVGAGRDAGTWAGGCCCLCGGGVPAPVGASGAVSLPGLACCPDPASQSSLVWGPGALLAPGPLPEATVPGLGPARCHLLGLGYFATSAHGLLHWSLRVPPPPPPRRAPPVLEQVRPGAPSGEALTARPLRTSRTSRAEGRDSEARAGTCVFGLRSQSTNWGCVKQWVRSLGRGPDAPDQGAGPVPAESAGETQPQPLPPLPVSHRAAPLRGPRVCASSW
uniref:Peptidase metallopeptidase domain-containing protein n=1 Tax=Panthera leo TaxID=9689 RepID=A0A8C8YAE3_PANLE